MKRKYLGKVFASLLVVCLVFAQVIVVGNVAKASIIESEKKERIVEIAKDYLAMESPFEDQYVESVAKGSPDQEAADGNSNLVDGYDETEVTTIEDEESAAAYQLDDRDFGARAMVGYYLILGVIALAALFGSAAIYYMKREK